MLFSAYARVFVCARNKKKHTFPCPDLEGFNGPVFIWWTRHEHLDVWRKNTNTRKMDKNRMQIETTGRFPHRGEVWGFRIWSSQVLNNCPVFEVRSIEKYVETSQYVGSPNQTPRDWSFFVCNPPNTVKGSEELHGKLLINSLRGTSMAAILSIISPLL